MNLPMLAAFGPLLPNKVNSRAAGMIHREFPEDASWGGLPSWKMHVYTHGALTVGVPYVIGFTAAYPMGLTSVPATNFNCIVGIAPRTTTAASWEELTVMGLCLDAVTTAAVPADSSVEVINAGVSVIDDGSNAPLKTANSLAVALEAGAGDTVDIMMYGTVVDIAAA